MPVAGEWQGRQEVNSQELTNHCVLSTEIRQQRRGLLTLREGETREIELPRRLSWYMQRLGLVHDADGNIASGAPRD